MSEDAAFEVVVAAKRRIAEDICELRLGGAGGEPLPAWEPGAHVDLELPSGLVRQYSLCSTVENDDHYRIAVRVLADGRGGSLEVDSLSEGHRLRIRAVRNTFPLSDAGRYLFIAGGIGITPILPMAVAAANRGVPTHLMYLVRNAGTLAFADELVREGLSVDIVLTDTDGIPDLTSAVRSSPGAQIYCCGPAPMMDALQAVAAAEGRSEDVYLERFESPQVAAGSGTTTIRCVRSGVSVCAESEETFLEALRGAGFDLPSSCEMGICGTCQITVVGGTPDHRDMLLTPEEREAGAFLPCVSRSNSDHLDVDL
jgi:tetrachlorobenzoquinone reductase